MSVYFRKQDNMAFGPWFRMSYPDRLWPATTLFIPENHCNIASGTDPAAGTVKEGFRNFWMKFSDADCHLLKDRSYEDDATRRLACKRGSIPIVSPKKNRHEPWEYDKDLYKRCNEVERVFRRIKRFRRIFTRQKKTDTMFTAFITLAIIVDKLC